MKPAAMTLEQLRAVLIAEARKWIAWGGDLDGFLDGGPLPSPCHYAGRTGPGQPCLLLTRKGAAGHRSEIFAASLDYGEIRLTWTQIRHELARDRGGEQLALEVA
jgi:hypothetical protein